MLVRGERADCTPDELTVADLLSDAGYATACIGKWHLGHQPRERYLPVNQGFDYYYGIPYSNSYSPEWKAKYPPLPLIRGTETIEQSIDQDTMTRDFTDEAIAFVRRHARRDGNEPFSSISPTRCPTLRGTPPSASGVFRS